MEARGIPAAVLGTDAFLSLARAQAAKLGLPHLAVALVGHPIGGIDPAIVRGTAETIVEPPGHKPPVTTKSRKATDGHSAD